MDPGQAARDVKTQVISNVMARAMATTFAAPLVASTISRSLVDQNRSVAIPVSIISRQFGKYLPRCDGGSWSTTIRLIVRGPAERLIMLTIMDRGRVIHLSSHGFTSEMDGKPRRADIGLLYDPRPERLRRICASAGRRGIPQGLCARSHRSPKLPVGG
jgi:predicted N-formylglutamate amidohydrolase